MSFTLNYHVSSWQTTSSEAGIKLQAGQMFCFVFNLILKLDWNEHKHTQRKENVAGFSEKYSFIPMKKSSWPYLKQHLGMIEYWFQLDNCGTDRCLPLFCAPNHVSIAYQLLAIFRSVCIATRRERTLYCTATTLISFPPIRLKATVCLYVWLSDCLSVCLHKIYEAIVTLLCNREEGKEKKKKS